MATLSDPEANDLAAEFTLQVLYNVYRKLLGVHPPPLAFDGVLKTNVAEQYFAEVAAPSAAKSKLLDYVKAMREVVARRFKEHLTNMESATALVKEGEELLVESGREIEQLKAAGEERTAGLEEQLRDATLSVRTLEAKGERLEATALKEREEARVLQDKVKPLL